MIISKKMIEDNLYVDEFPKESSPDLQCINCGYIKMEPYALYYNRGYCCPSCEIQISWPKNDGRKNYLRLYEKMTSNKPVRMFYERKKRKEK